VDSVEFNYALGFREANLEFLTALPIRRLLILDRSLVDLSPVARIAPTLEELRVEAASGARIDVSALPGLRVLAASWDQVAESIRHAQSLRWVTLGDYDGVDLQPLSVLDLEVVELQGADSLESLDGVGYMQKLDALRIFEAGCLRALSGVEALAANIRELELQDCTLIQGLSSVRTLGRLTFLGFSNCGLIESLDPIDAHTELTAVHAWGTTRVADCDLSALTRLPKLVDLRMRDRPEYRPRVSEIAKNLRNR
jgi:hypothetical protein